VQNNADTGQGFFCHLVQTQSVTDFPIGRLPKSLISLYSGGQRLPRQFQGLIELLRAHLEICAEISYALLDACPGLVAEERSASPLAGELIVNDIDAKTPVDRFTVLKQALV
jgi:hypothetical protein